MVSALTLHLYRKAEGRRIFGALYEENKKGRKGFLRRSVLSFFFGIGISRQLSAKSLSVLEGLLPRESGLIRGFEKGPV